MGFLAIVGWWLFSLVVVAVGGVVFGLWLDANEKPAKFLKML